MADSDLVLTIVRRLATRLAGHMGLVIRRPPIELRCVRVPLVWHARAHHELGAWGAYWVRRNRMRRHTRWT